MRNIGLKRRPELGCCVTSSCQILHFISSPTLPICWPVNGPFHVAYIVCIVNRKKSQLGGKGDRWIGERGGEERASSYIADLSIMCTPCVHQLPLAVLLIPHFHPMIRRCRDNAVPVEIELGHRDQVLMSGIEVSEPGHFLLSFFFFLFRIQCCTTAQSCANQFQSPARSQTHTIHIHSSAPGNASSSCMNEAGSHEAREPRPLM